MSETIEFAKLSGSGNDFICIDNRHGRYDALLADAAKVGHFARTLCRRGLSVGADGVIFGCQSEMPQAHLASRFFEADGSEAELCGNGVACMARWAMDQGWGPRETVKILTQAGVVTGKPSDGLYIRACIPLPVNMQRSLDVPVLGKTWRCDYVVTGVPHLVVEVDSADDFDVARWGPALRHHPQFAPRGVNANFVHVLGEGEIANRTYEFGVEGETLACGTGSAAAAILTALRLNWRQSILAGEEPVRVHTRGGDVMRVYFTLQSGGHVDDVCLETVVRFIYSGTLHAETARQACSA